MIESALMEPVLSSFATYYGLDWLALAFGLYGMILITGQNRTGFILSILGCLCGFAVAMISGQYGFVLYNLALVTLMARGFWRWRTERDLSTTL